MSDFTPQPLGVLGIARANALYVALAPATSARNTVQSSAAAAIPLTLKAHASQSVALQEWQNSSGTPYYSINNDGTMTSSVALTNPASAKTGRALTFQIYRTGAADTFAHIGFNLDFRPTGTQAYTASLKALQGAFYSNTTGTVSSAYGLLFGGGCLNTGNITSLACIRLETFSSGAGTIGTLIGVSIKDQSLYSSPTTQVGFDYEANTGAVGTNKYGLRIGNISGASSNNYAIYTNTGLVRFGDDVITTASITVGAAEAFYLGDENTNDTWRIIRSGNNLVIQRREAGSYVTKSTIAA